MAPLTGFRRWLTPIAQLRANSWMLMTGSFGMVASTLPVQWLVPVMGWRPLFWILALAVGVAMAVIAWKVPHWDRRRARPAGRPGSYAQVWRHPYFRRMSAIGFFNYGGMIAIQTLWAGPWMVRVTGDAPLEAATGLFAINLSMLGTFWSWGMLNPWLARKGLTTERLIARGVPLSLVVLAAIIVAGPAAGAGAWALFCMTSTFVSLAQPAVGDGLPAGAGRPGAVGLQPGDLRRHVRGAVGHRAAHRWLLPRPGWMKCRRFGLAMAVFLVCSVISYGYFVLAKDNSRQ